MEKHSYEEYLEILKEELVPALGCTEPIAIAYAAAKAREVLGKMPESITPEQLWSEITKMAKYNLQ